VQTTDYLIYIEGSLIADMTLLLSSSSLPLTQSLIQILVKVQQQPPVSTRRSCQIIYGVWTRKLSNFVIQTTFFILFPIRVNGLLHLTIHGFMISSSSFLKVVNWVWFKGHLQYCAKSTFLCLLYINMCPLCVKRFWKFQEKIFAHFLSWSNCIKSCLKMSWSDFGHFMIS